MHYHLEVIMPPVPNDEIERRVSQIMEPFDENGDGREPNPHAFWDFWVIGGRWSQQHLTSGLNQETLDAFGKRLQEEKITVSGLQSGKQEINPADQIPKVDAIWREFFPDFPGKHCPLFKHADPMGQYDNHTQWPDVMPVGELPSGAEASHLIVAAEAEWHDDKPFRAEYMIAEEMWNGVIHVPTKWDGRISTAIDAHHKRLTWCAGEYREQLTVQPNWLAVTVDYHS